MILEGSLPMKTVKVSERCMCVCECVCWRRGGMMDKSTESVGSECTRLKRVYVSLLNCGIYSGIVVGP